MLKGKLFILFLMTLVVPLILSADAIANTYAENADQATNQLLYSSIELSEVDPPSSYSWPMFRHNLNRTGYTESPAPINNQTIWTYQTEGPVYSSPAVVDGKVYVGSTDGYLYCLNATTITSDGELVWRYQTGGAVCSSPAVADGQVFFGSDDGYMYCLNATTGNLIWKFPTGDAVRSSPAVSEEKVIFGSNDGYVYAVDRYYIVNGTPYLIWKFGPIGSMEYSSPSVFNNYVFVGGGNYIYCLNKEATDPNGELVWQHQLCLAGHVYCPAIEDHQVFVSYVAGEEWSDPSAIACLDAFSGTIIWKYGIGRWEYLSSVAIAYGKVFVSNGIKLMALNQSNGTLLWETPLRASGDLCLPKSSPAIADKKIFIGCSYHGDFFCLDEHTGDIMWKYEKGETFRSSPAVNGGRVYIGCDDGQVLAFGNASSLTVSATPSEITLGGSTLISGRLTDVSSAEGLPSMLLRLEYSTDRGETWNLIDSVTTTSDGSFTYVWTPPTAGHYITVKATFFGDLSHNGATASCFLHVNRISSFLSVSVNPSAITYGRSTQIEGALTDPNGIGIPEQTIRLEYSTDGFTYNSLASVITLSNGNYSYQWSPPAASYTIRANFTGNVNYTESSSTTQLVVNKASTMVAISIKPSTVSCGGITTINGSLQDQYGMALSGQTITLEYSMDNGESWNTITLLNTLPDGSYLYPWTPQQVGSYLIRATYAGDSNHNPSDNSTSLSVIKGASSITTIVAAATITYGQSVTISSLVSPPASDGTVTFQWSIDNENWNIIDSGTPTNGTFSTTWTPPHVGTFYVRALWSGGFNYNGSTSPSETIAVTKASTSITVSLSSITISHGQNITATGTISPITEGTVTLEYSVDGATWITIASGATSMGSYSTVWVPPDVGLFYIRARWDGNANYNGATSITETVTVDKANTTLNLLCPETITYGFNVPISGTISPALSEALINLEYSADNGDTWNSLTTLTTNTTGGFSYVWIQPTSGLYQIRASWSGNTQYQGATSLPAHLTINKAPSSITCTLSTTSAIVKSSITISGKISPAIPKATITIYYKAEGMATYNILATTQTDDQGNYEYTWTPQSSGTYEMTTAWTGSNNYDGAQSGVHLLNVLSPGQISYNELINELSQAKMLQYIFLTTTIAFLISTMYLAIRKRYQAGTKGSTRK